METTISRLVFPRPDPPSYTVDDRHEDAVLVHIRRGAATQRANFAYYVSPNIKKWREKQQEQHMADGDDELKKKKSSSRLPAASSSPRYLMLYGHPNAVDIAQMLPEASYISHKANIDVLLWEFKGYGLNTTVGATAFADPFTTANTSSSSTAAPSAGTTTCSGVLSIEPAASERGLFLDIEAALDFAVSDLGIPTHQIILGGWSIGTGPSAHLAAMLPSILKCIGGKDRSTSSSPQNLPLAGVFLQAPFTSILDTIDSVIDVHTDERSNASFMLRALKAPSKALAKKIVSDRFRTIDHIHSICAVTSDSQNLCKLLRDVYVRTHPNITDSDGEEHVSHNKRNEGVVHTAALLWQYIVVHFVCPPRILIQHGSEDQIVPHAHGVKLMENITAAQQCIPAPVTVKEPFIFTNTNQPQHAGSSSGTSSSAGSAALRGVIEAVFRLTEAQEELQKREQKRIKASSSSSTKATSAGSSTSTSIDEEKHKLQQEHQLRQQLTLLLEACLKTLATTKTDDGSQKKSTEDTAIQTQPPASLRYYPSYWPLCPPPPPPAPAAGGSGTMTAVSGGSTTGTPSVPSLPMPAPLAELITCDGYGHNDLSIKDATTLLKHKMTGPHWTGHQRLQLVLEALRSTCSSSTSQDEEHDADAAGAFLSEAARLVLDAFPSTAMADLEGVVVPHRLPFFTTTTDNDACCLRHVRNEEEAGAGSYYTRIYNATPVMVEMVDNANHHHLANYERDPVPSPQTHHALPTHHHAIPNETIDFNDDTDHHPQFNTAGFGSMVTSLFLGSNNDNATTTTATATTAGGAQQQQEAPPQQVQPSVPTTAFGDWATAAVNRALAAPFGTTLLALCGSSSDGSGVGEPSTVCSCCCDAGASAIVTASGRRNVLLPCAQAFQKCVNPTTAKDGAGANNEKVKAILAREILPQPQFGLIRDAAAQKLFADVLVTSACCFSQHAALRWIRLIRKRQIMHQMNTLLQQQRQQQQGGGGGGSSWAGSSWAGASTGRGLPSATTASDGSYTGQAYTVDSNDINSDDHRRDGGGAFGGPRPLPPMPTARAFLQEHLCLFGNPFAVYVLPITNGERDSDMWKGEARSTDSTNNDTTTATVTISAGFHAVVFGSFIPDPASTSSVFTENNNTTMPQQLPMLHPQTPFQCWYLHNLTDSAAASSSASGADNSGAASSSSPTAALSPIRQNSRKAKRLLERLPRVPVFELEVPDAILSVIATALESIHGAEQRKASRRHRATTNPQKNNVGTAEGETHVALDGELLQLQRQLEACDNFCAAPNDTNNNDVTSGGSNNSNSVLLNMGIAGALPQTVLVLNEVSVSRIQLATERLVCGLVRREHQIIADMLLPWWEATRRGHASGEDEVVGEASSPTTDVVIPAALRNAMPLSAILTPFLRLLAKPPSSAEEAPNRPAGQDVLRSPFLMPLLYGPSDFTDQTSLLLPPTLLARVESTFSKDFYNKVGGEGSLRQGVADIRRRLALLIESFVGGEGGPTTTPPSSCRDSVDTIIFDLLSLLLRNCPEGLCGAVGCGRFSEADAAVCLLQELTLKHYILTETGKILHTHPDPDDDDHDDTEEENVGGDGTNFPRDASRRLELIPDEDAAEGRPHDVPPVLTAGAVLPLSLPIVCCRPCRYIVADVGGSDALSRGVVSATPFNVPTIFHHDDENVQTATPVANPSSTRTSFINERDVLWWICPGSNSDAGGGREKSNNDCVIA